LSFHCHNRQSGNRKLWLELYYPLHHSGRDVTFTKEISDGLFISSIEAIDDCRNFSKAQETHKWGWYARARVQWHAVAYILAELCHRDASAMTRRAWKAIEEIFATFGEEIEEKKNVPRWKPLKLLRQRAL